MADYPTSFDKEALLKCARGGFFAEGNAQLAPPPMLMMDRITDVSADGGAPRARPITAEFDITPDLWFFGLPLPANRSCPAGLAFDGLVAADRL